jgi:hypothetical protein
MRFLIKPRKESMCTNNFGKKTSEYPTGNPISGKRRERGGGITKKKDCFFSER